MLIEYFGSYFVHETK